MFQCQSVSVSVSCSDNTWNCRVGSYDYECPRGSQLRLLAELRGPEEVHHADLSHVKQEVGNLKNTSLTEANLREEFNAGRDNAGGKIQGFR